MLLRTYYSIGLFHFKNIERYAQYLDLITSSNIIGYESDLFICNCTTNRIGLSCEYELFSDLFTLVQVFQFQLSRPAERNNEIPACFVDEIQCNAGMLCLEWRQVCDSIINCDNGADEINCHLLEFYNCASDEFQCRNGMCIPLEFLFDGSIDCMDTSDEQEMFNTLTFSERCPLKSTLECDERLCSKNEFSCGDGQCVHWSNLIHHRETCRNYRDVVYRCESVPRMGRGINGICSLH